MSESQLNARMLYLVGEPDGAERVDVADLFAQRLAGMGLQVDYVIFEYDSHAFFETRPWRGARAFVTGLPDGGGALKRLGKKFRELAVDLGFFWKSLTGDYDIIQVRDKFVVAVLALLAARLRGRKYVYWLSYPMAECRIIDGREKLSRFPLLSIAGGHAAAWLLYKVIMPNADHVFVQSEQMRRDIIAEGVAPELMTPVPMGVSDTLLERVPAEIVPQSVIYVGTMVRVRRLEIIIDAFARVLDQYPEARLVMVGEGTGPEDRRVLQERAAELGVAESVEFTGMLPMEQAHARVRESAVGLSPFYPTPILQSTSPTKISEYLALGRPVVANTHPEQSAILGECGGGICVEWSVDEFAQAISRLFADPGAANDMGAKGREWVRANRIYPVIAAELATDYERILLPPGQTDSAPGAGSQ